MAKAIVLDVGEAAEGEAKGGKEGKAAVQAARRRWVDHPLAAWAIENGSIVSVALLKYSIGLPEVQSFPRIFLRNFMGGLIMIEGSIAVQKFLVSKVYEHLPYFSKASETRSHMPWRQLLAEWWQCNFRTHLMSSAVVAALLHSRSRAMYEGILRKRPFRLLRFLGKLAVVRVVSDIAFYGIHRALHSRKLYRFHKRHHEHTSTALATNMHFSVMDLFLEGFCPLMSGIIALEGLGMGADALESSLISAYIQWFEIGSHSGKPVPTVTILPPLAPLYRLALGDVDARNIEFHDCHHAYRNCNYGISQWLDYLVGSVRLRAR